MLPTKQKPAGEGHGNTGKKRMVAGGTNLGAQRYGVYFLPPSLFFFLFFLFLLLPWILSNGGDKTFRVPWLFSGNLGL